MYQSTLYFFILKSRDRLQTRVERLSYFYNTLIISNHNSKRDKLQNFNTQRTLEKGTKNPDYIRQTQHDGTPSNASSRTCIRQAQQERLTGKDHNFEGNLTLTVQKTTSCRRLTLSYVESSRTVQNAKNELKINMRTK